MASSSLARPPSHHRHTSQSTSTSSSSVVTVQRAPSKSSRNGLHQTTANLRSRSPNDAGALPPQHATRMQPPEAPRRSASLYRPDSRHEVREGVGNLNRWSQSSTSSKSSGTHRRRSSFSNRLSGSLGSFGGRGSSQAVSPSGAPKPPLPLHEHTPGPSGKSSPAKPPKLPPLVTLSVLSKALDAADTPSTAATTTPTTAELLSTSASTSAEGDYFGDQWQGAAAAKPKLAPPQSVAALSSARTSPSPKRGVSATGARTSGLNDRVDPAVSGASSRTSSRTNPSEGRPQSRHRHSRNRDDPRKCSTGTEGESSASSIHSPRARAPKRKTNSQTIVLSKALQKANHAVLLDNAQNFEGAMNAYADACSLLQRVISTSSTDEDRRKLAAVVSETDRMCGGESSLTRWT